MQRVGQPAWTPASRARRTKFSFTASLCGVSDKRSMSDKRSRRVTVLKLAPWADVHEQMALAPLDILEAIKANRVLPSRLSTQGVPGSLVLTLWLLRGKNGLLRQSLFNAL